MSILARKEVPNQFECVQVFSANNGRNLLGITNGISYK